jgi:hypothetical protein
MIVEPECVNVEWARKGEGIYYGDGSADLAKSVAIAAASCKSAEGRARAVHEVLRQASKWTGQSPDIETFVRPEHGGWRVSWESGPFSWATVASEALCQVGVFAEPYYNFDLCFYPED